MVRRPFTTREIKDVLRGVFPSDRTDDASDPANRLAKKGFLKKLDTNLWQITPEGLAELQRSIAYYRELKLRVLGASYIEKVSERERRARMKVNLSDQLDMEEEILEEMAQRIDAVKERKVRKRNQRRKNA